MHETILLHQSAIAGICRAHGVHRLELFGSATTGDFDPTSSDFDFVVNFADRSPGYARRYLSFAEALETLLGRHVDVVTERSIKNPYFRQSVDSSKVTIYESETGSAAA